MIFLAGLDFITRCLLFEISIDKSIKISRLKKMSYSIVNIDVIAIENASANGIDNNSINGNCKA